MNYCQQKLNVQFQNLDILFTILNGAQNIGNSCYVNSVGKSNWNFKVSSFL